MNAFSFHNPYYREVLDRLVIHMDQGACYNPEYLATRHMHDYPSRVAQIIRAVLYSELTASPYGAQIVFRSILSGQGERWQNFGETPDDGLLVQLLGRHLFAQKGLANCWAGQDFSVPESPQSRAAWAGLRTVPDGDHVLALDDATYAYAAGSAGHVGTFLHRRGITLCAVQRLVTGFSAMAHGFLEEGTTQLRQVVENLNRCAAKVLTLSGAAYWALVRLTEVMGLERRFEVVDILDYATELNMHRAYVYGGSAYIRFLGKGPRLMQLSPNTWERPVLNAPEFLPLLDADTRINSLTSFSPPVCAEYLNQHTAADILQRIKEAACAHIRQSGCEQLVVCEPFAYNALGAAGCASGGVRYFLDVLT